MEALRFLAGRPVSPTRLRVFLIAFAAGGFALFSATWKLWTPQDVYPQVPVFVLFGGIPAVVEWIVFVLVFVSLIALHSSGTARAVRCAYQRGRTGGLAPCRFKYFTALGAGAKHSLALIAFAFSAIVLFLVDQHRLQPWAYQFVVFAIVLAVLPAARAFVLLRWIVVSIYLWSAVAKLDFSFHESQGQQFLAAGLGLIGMSAEDWSPATRNAAALSFPMTELAIAIGFSLPLHRWKYLRRATLTLAIGMHVLVILLLSPLGLNHQPAVILWNIWFIAQAWLLFGSTDVGRALLPVEDDNHDRRRAGVPVLPNHSPLWRDLAGVAVEFLVVAVIFLPALNLAGRYDHWLAWGLYAPRNPRATLYIQDASSERLPQALRKYLSPNVSDEGWRRLRLDLWSLDTLSVPIYPQDRFQFGVGEAVIREHSLQNGFQLVVESSPDRWTGKRTRAMIRNMAELEAYKRRYLLNATPRRSTALEGHRTTTVSITLSGAAL